MKKPEPILLGIETGGTKTIAIAATPSLRKIARLELGPANLRLSSDAQLLSHFREIKSATPTPAAIGIGLPGLRTAQDEARVTGLLKKVWPNTPARSTHDLDLALHAAATDEKTTKTLAKVIVLSGTGSCCYGQSADGRTAKLGGWGHLLGDKGSGYDIALRGCRAAVYYFDRDGEWTALGQSILRELALNEPNDLIAWIQSADKKQIAALAIAVFDAWKKGDRHAQDIIESTAHGLAADALKCAARLDQPDATLQFILAGSVLLKQPKFAARVAEPIRAKWPQAVITPLAREGAWGGIHIAKSLLSSDQPAQAPAVYNEKPVAVGLEKSPTEMRNPRSLKLDQLSSREAVALFLDEEKHTLRGLCAIAPQIEKALDLIVASFKKGGRLFYVGAGTSGRLGILDASECPPTFRTDPEMVQGIIAGGQPAIFRAVEGAEDDVAAGSRAIAGRGVTARDIVLGIAASGRTPFVWGAFAEARQRKAKTILLTLNPGVQLPKTPKLDLLLAADVGPELLTGSTRLKSGTATKLILNILTTLAMVRLGKVASNLMIDLNPSNVKLRDRAIRIVQQLNGGSREEAESALESNGWIVSKALLADKIRKR
jgi:N-acetylmuramic acid 6-phosphate etherase